MKIERRRGSLSNSHQFKRRKVVKEELISLNIVSRQKINRVQSRKLQRIQRITDQIMRFLVHRSKLTTTYLIAPSS